MDHSSATNAVCCVKLSPARSRFKGECHKIYDAWPPSYIYTLCPAVVLHLVLFYLPTYSYTHVVVEYVLARHCRLVLFGYS